jgi:hypothetical protein
MELYAVTGASWSNSYIESLTEADALIPELPASAATAWAAIEEAAYKKQILIAGADFLGFAFTLRGYKAYVSQRLAFPRKEFPVYTYGQTFSGYEPLPDPVPEIPHNAKLAQLYCAIFVIYANDEARAASATADTERKAVTSFSISGLSISLGTSVAGAGTIQEYIKSQHLTLYLLMQDFATQAKGGAVKRKRQYAAIATTSTTTTTSTTSTSTSSSSTTSTTT